jgi:nicotinamidase-related amidase
MQVAQMPDTILEISSGAGVVDAFIIVDMQVGLLDGAPKHDLQGVIDRINSLSQMVRSAGGKVIWIRHCGTAGDGFERCTTRWEFLPELIRRHDDVVVEKTLNDPYIGTPLADTLAQMQPRRILVAGWATDFCVDATVRSTVCHDHHVVAVSDAHTLSDRPHLPASTIITHHNWLWSGLITNCSVRVVSSSELLAEGSHAPGA